MKRVVVIGAGPAGSAAAMGLQAYARCSTVAIECVLLDRKSFPRTKPCGSGLSPWTLKWLDAMGVGQEVRRHAFRIDGAIIAGSRGPGVELRGDHETAILLRSELDERLARAAVARGASLRDGVGVRRIEGDGSRGMCVHTGDGPIEADAVLDCSGATGGLSRPAGSRRGAAALHTIMGWYEGVADVSDVVELYFDPVVKPHYGWVFPESPKRVNIGLCYWAGSSGANARERLEAFMEDRLQPRLRHAERLGQWVGHPVHVRSWPRGLSRPGGLIAGEAGALADAATAEGIFHALRSGWTAGDCAGRSLSQHGRIVRSVQLDYERQVARQLGPRMLAGRALAEALKGSMLDFVLRFQARRATRAALAKAFTGLYHG